MTLLHRYGPWALIAGASEGIGAAFARALAAAGFNLVLIARRREPLEALATELRARCTVETVALDLAAPDLEGQLETIAAAHDFGLIVYNAALSIVAPFLDTPLADKQRSLDVNARGPLIAAHVFGNRFAARGRGGIVLISSLTAFWGSAWVATYGATKAFNLSLGEALAHELAERNVDVVVSCAGATRTPGFVQQMTGRKAPRSMSPDAVAAETLAALPARGAFVPGKFNRFAQQLLSRALPRRTAVRIMAGQTKALI
ncbi:MAG TPA: SDR family NAD(P)-dependent oxidoreductase [Polyangiales bacterium]|nr:SDR family NAD(P)-dependent oxidoreductase [Polyangiales bacterium]